LSKNAVTSGSVDDGRVRFGLPVSVELDRGSGRVYGSAGFFSRGIRFAGFGVGTQPGPKLGVSLSFSRAWATSNLDPTLPSATRNEISTGASYSMTPKVSVFGSVGHTIAMADENGAGTSVSIGAAFLLGPVVISP